MRRIVRLLLGALVASSRQPLPAQSAPSLDDDLRVRRPAYLAAGPLVLFDAAHSNVHTSTGRYERFTSLIRADGYRIAPNTLPLDRGQLRPGAVLVIVSALGANRDSTPELSSRPAFTSREVDSVEVWVRRGGSLLLIVDHEPTGIANAALAARFGVHLADGWVEDPDSAHHWSGCRGCLRFTRATGLLGDHPITEGRDSTERVRGVVSAVGQSLGSPPGTAVLLRLGPGALDIHAGGDTTSATGRSQGVARAFGAGRVVVLGEAAMLAGQAAPRPDSPFRRWWSQEPGIHNRQFALNVMHWLSGVLPIGSAPP